MNTLYIIRGPFGSHKHEFAKSICENVVSCWDHYNIHGEKEFNPDLKAGADAYCRDRTKEFLRLGKENVAVVNSLSLISDLQPYKEMAKEFGYRTFILISDQEITEHDLPTNVSKEMVKQQAKKLERNSFNTSNDMMWL